MYAEHEFLANNYDNVEKIFNRCLVNCLNIELWKYYLQYVKTGPKSNNFDEVRKVYEFAIDNIGFDINSTEIWIDYIELLKKMRVCWNNYKQYTNANM